MDPAVIHSWVRKKVGGDIKPTSAGPGSKYPGACFNGATLIRSIPRRAAVGLWYHLFGLNISG